MHVPDGFLDVPTSATTGVVATLALGLSLRGARGELADRTAPLAGLVAAFIFAAQLISFPIAAGTNAHLLGGVLAAILVGPYTAVLCTSVVLAVQCLVMAYGGVSTAGASMIVMDLAPIVAGYGVFLAARALLPRSPTGIMAAAGLGAFVSAVAGAFAFTGLVAAGGTAGIPLGTVLAAVVGAHLVVGAAEAALTALTVRSLLVIRPDLVRGARDLLPALEIRAPVPERAS
jgi:cobalt/nickel transport system permease protein